MPAPTPPSTPPSSPLEPITPPQKPRPIEPLRHSPRIRKPPRRLIDQNSEEAVQARLKLALVTASISRKADEPDVEALGDRDLKQLRIDYQWFWNERKNITFATLPTMSYNRKQLLLIAVNHKLGRMAALIDECKNFTAATKLQHEEAAQKKQRREGQPRCGHHNIKEHQRGSAQG
jgi:hypothetical protein